MCAESCHLTHKGAQPHAIVGVEAGGGRVGSGAITNAPIGDGEDAIGTHMASCRGCGGADIADLMCAHVGKAVQSGDYHLFAISHADAVAGVGADLVGFTYWLTSTKKNAAK